MRNMHRRSERINEQDVPESQHTVFIRGLPGSVTTSEIREFFEDSFGSCTFDFIKLSKDREKLHVAVRFVSKTAARECMEKYRDGELFGYPVQLTWFRDIRRYLNHLSKQGNLQRRRFDDDRRRGGYHGRRNWGNRSKSRSRSISKSPIRRSHSRSQSRSQSVSSTRSNGAEANDTVPTGQLSVSPEPRRSKKSKKERRKRRRHSTSQSRSRSPPPRGSDHEEETFSRINNTTGDGDAPSDMDTSDGELQASDGRFSLNNFHNQQNDSPTVPAPKKMQIADLRSSTTSLLQNTSFTVDLESNNPPRQNIRKDYYAQTSQPSESNENGSRKGVFLPPKEFEANDADQQKSKAMHIKQEIVNKQNEHEQQQYRLPPPRHDPADNGGFDHTVINSSAQEFSSLEDGNAKRRHIRNQTPPAPPSEFERATAGTPAFNGAMTDFKAIQRSILQDVRYKPQDTPEKEKVGNFRLSSLSTQKSLEEIRQEKMSRLSNELQEKVERKKVQLELSYRHDCETFGLMTRKLISKDRSLEERLRLALLEIMKDLETEAMKNLDEYLDQMIFLSV